MLPHRTNEGLGFLLALTAGAAVVVIVMREVAVPAGKGMKLP
jgi:hypothetical protein